MKRYVVIFCVGSKEWAEYVNAFSIKEAIEKVKSANPDGCKFKASEAGL